MKNANPTIRKWTTKERFKLISVFSDAIKIASASNDPTIVHTFCVYIQLLTNASADTLNSNAMFQNHLKSIHGATLLITGHSVFFDMDAFTDTNDEISFST